MAKYSGFKTVSKVPVNTKEELAVVYTPGVSASCLKIQENEEASFDYTNRENSIAVISLDYEKSLERALFLKSTLNIDAYPLEISSSAPEKIKLAVDNIEPSFAGIDLSLMSEYVQNIDFDVKIPVLKTSANPAPAGGGENADGRSETSPVSESRSEHKGEAQVNAGLEHKAFSREGRGEGCTKDLKEFFLCVSKNIYNFKYEDLEGSAGEKSLQLRKKAGGVVEIELTEDEQKKPIGIVTDGSAVLGLGNIGSEAGLPVMEGKAVLFQELGNVSAMPLCLKTQKPAEVVEIVLLLQNSFSGINLEDIKAPECFEVENTLIEKASIPIFHDDQHGTAIVVLAALLNALHLAGKKLDEAKIVFSGAGAAAIAVCKLLLSAGAANITMFDIHGAVYKGRKENNSAHEEISETTNLNGFTGTLKEGIKNADVFIGLSAPELVDEEMIKSMNNKPIVFALANPVPEIMPDAAKKAGAFIAASGRSDFPNQINNCLVFPGLFNGVLKHNIKKITQKMKINSAFALASIVKDDELSADYILPDALDFRVPAVISDNIDYF